MAIIEGVRKRKPFNTVPVRQDMVLGYSSHFSQIFKKTVKNKNVFLKIQKACVLDYYMYFEHPTEVWVKYTANEAEQWSKFSIFKHRCVPSLPSPENIKYNRVLPIKDTKTKDLKTMVEKFVPAEYKGFYESLVVNNDVSSDTDEMIIHK